MCGRYAASRSPEDLIVAYEAVDGTGDIRLPADFNVAPTASVYAVRAGGPAGTPEPAAGGRELVVMRWGLVPAWADDPRIGARFINARAETVADQPVFRDAFARRRCLVPADGWFEWTARSDGSGKQPVYVTPDDGAGLVFAGLWEQARRGESWLVTCTIVTTQACGKLTAVHHRMPLVLPPERHAAWLDPDQPDPSSLLAAPPGHLVAGLELRPVGPAVGNVANTGPELLRPYVEPAPLTLF